MAIKAIETEYNGYRFRSRLEARWAVFFDEAKIRYEYEPEGYDLDGVYYLPDFYLPEFELFVEIKPFDPNIVTYVGDGNKWEKTCERFRDHTDRAILLCYGDPAAELWNLLFAYDTTDSGGGVSNWYSVFTETNNKTVLVTEPSRSDRTIHVYNWMQSNDLVGTSNQLTGKNGLFESAFSEMNRVNDARIAARQARFEYGETPTKEDIT